MNSLKANSSRSRALCALAILVVLARPVAAQNTLSIGQAVTHALGNYPAIQVSQEQMNAAAARIRLAQTAYLPRIDGLAQVNRATRNTFYGLLLPQNIIPGIDGVPANNLGTVWDSGIGVLVSWQPFDFGERAANVATATAIRNQAKAAVNRTRHEVSIAAADAFLTVIAAQQTAEAARASVDSWQLLLKSIHALVSAQLRPGADESRVEAELAAARTQVAQAEQAIDVAKSNVSQFSGISLSELALTPGKLADQLPQEQSEPPFDAAQNPLTIEQSAAVTQAQSQLKVLERTYYPQFLIQGVASARGTGLLSDGARLGGWNGLAPTTQNYGLGLTVTFPAMDRFAIHEQEAIQSANIRAAQAQNSLIATNLQAQFSAALAGLAGARRVAANTPIEVSAGQTTLEQATARYKAGLAPIDDVAQAQRLLVQAKIDDALSRLNVWRAELQIAAIRGDIQPFLTQASQ